MGPMIPKELNYNLHYGKVRDFLRMYFFFLCISGVGINSGVMLMNLTRLRVSNFSSSLDQYYKRYASMLYLGDQDLLNVYFYFHSRKLSILGLCKETWPGISFPTILHLCPAKTHISLCNHAVRSEALLCEIVGNAVPPVQYIYIYI